MSVCVNFCMSWCVSARGNNSKSESRGGKAIHIEEQQDKKHKLSTLVLTAAVDKLKCILCFHLFE